MIIDQSTKRYFILGALFALASVALGAFGAHGLKQVIAPDMMRVYQTGVEYQMFHALGILFITLLRAHLRINDRYVLTRALNSLIFGVLVFCVSLYALALSGLKWLGAITPIGGVAFLLGWGFLIYGIIVMPSSPTDNSKEI